MTLTSGVQKYKQDLWRSACLPSLVIIALFFFSIYRGHRQTERQTYNQHWLPYPWSDFVKLIIPTLNNQFNYLCCQCRLGSEILINVNVRLLTKIILKSDNQSTTTYILMTLTCINIAELNNFYSHNNQYFIFIISQYKYFIKRNYGLRQINLIICNEDSAFIRICIWFTVRQ